MLGVVLFMCLVGQGLIPGTILLRKNKQIDRYGFTNKTM